VLPVLLHGDAAFAGQGIVAECFGFSGLPGYGTGGTIHFVINNQVGFTTSPAIRALVALPVGHRQDGPGADPPRQRRRSRSGDLRLQARDRISPEFKRDIVIDMWCYRRFGHNEGDEPSFTQPLMYAKIRKHPPISDIYGARLVEEGVVDRAWIDRRIASFVACSKSEFEAAKTYLPNKADWFEGRWAGLGKPDDAETERRNVATAHRRGDAARESADPDHRPEGLDRPQDAAAHPRCQARDVRQRRGLRLGDRRSARLRQPGARRLPGPPVRPGQRPRHVQPPPRRLGRPADGRKYIPLCQVGPGRFEVRDSPLSEFGVLGFEYGYSLADPRTLVLWEAQFGDFANGAQVIIDQFIAVRRGQVAARQRPRDAAPARL
jgi:2-oxoglutarate dehydrogenase E1 component